jgi:hypothetical protein
VQGFVKFTLSKTADTLLVRVQNKTTIISSRLCGVVISVFATVRKDAGSNPTKAMNL